MLTSKQKRYLKGKATVIPALIQIGKEGLTDSVVASAKEAITARELIKVKINQNSDEDISDTASQLVRKLNCELVQIIGHTCILFKQKKEKSHYELN